MLTDVGEMDETDAAKLDVGEVMKMGLAVTEMDETSTSPVLLKISNLSWFLCFYDG